jgi:hypothetical protein
MTHALSTHFGASYFNSATVTNNAPIADPLVLAAEALPVFGGPEKALTE